MRYAIFFVLLASTLLMGYGCRSSKTEKASNETDTLYYPLDSIPSDGNVVRIRTAEDGKLKFYCWNTGGGGTMPIYGQICQYRSSNGKAITIEMDEEDFYKPWIHSVHSIRRDDGTTFYIVAAEHRISTLEGYMWLNGYEIDGDSLNLVNVIDPNDDAADSILSIRYDWAEFNIYEQGMPFEYDTITRTLYVPTTVDGEEDEMPLMADRYLVYQFNGKKFVFRGEHAHRGLNKAVEKYKRLMLVFITKDYSIRIDKLEDGDLRYASWKHPKTFSDKPDIIITGGVFCGTDIGYKFYNQGIEYDVDRYGEVTDPDGHKYGRGFLIVKDKNGRVLLNQARADFIWEWD